MSGAWFGPALKIMPRECIVAPSPVGPGALVILLPAVPVIVPGLVIQAATMATAHTERRAP
jgi:hypothetical protein